jgi:hypothetical protein
VSVRSAAAAPPGAPCCAPTKSNARAGTDSRRPSDSWTSALALPAAGPAAAAPPPCAAADAAAALNGAAEKRHSTVPSSARGRHVAAAAPPSLRVTLTAATSGPAPPDGRGANTTTLPETLQRAAGTARETVIL